MSSAAMCSAGRDGPPGRPAELTIADFCEAQLNWGLKSPLLGGARRALPQNVCMKSPERTSGSARPSLGFPGGGGAQGAPGLPDKVRTGPCPNCAANESDSNFPKFVLSFCGYGR